MPTTTIGTFHSAATSTGNGSSLAVPSGDIVVNVALTGSGPIGAVIQPQVSADNSTWGKPTRGRSKQRSMPIAMRCGMK